jgi:NAD(P)-dependent dehydrogenase (short-subunit alcohol dehydrogenase family)
MTWTNQVAVVTGGARGIGRAIALALAERGAAVCVNFTSRPDAAQQVQSEITSRGGRAITIQADVADFRAIESMIRRVEAELGAVTILVNNAGVAHQATLESFDHNKFEQMRRINVDGVIHTTRAVAQGMRDRRYGRIVNMASIAAIGTALPGNAFYAATKAEVTILTRRFAMELGADGTTVNAVAPGFVETDMTHGKRSGDDWGMLVKGLAERTMMRRIGQPSDIANAVTFLASPESSWITAQMLVVDGGRMDYIGHP